MDLTVDIPRIERRLARKQFVERGANRINIVQVIGPMPIQLLGTHVNQGASGALGLRDNRYRISHAAGQAEISNLQFALGTDHQVGRLEVPVCDFSDGMSVARGRRTTP